MIKLHLFLLNNRTRKKWQLYKQVFRLVFDLTTFIYSLFFFGYIIAVVFQEGNILHQFDEVIIELEAFTKERFWLIITIFPLFHLLRSYQQPGVLFTTAEYLLTILPNKRANIWLLIAGNRWLKALVIYLLGGLILYLFSPSSIQLIALYVCLLFSMNVLMTIPQWNFFQMNIWQKIAITLTLIAVNIVSVFIPSIWIGISIIALLIIYNIRSAPTLFTGIDWQKVTAASDFKLWNMMIISRVSGVKYKKERQYSVWQRLSFWKKPFPYEKKALYHRLWHLYFEKNIGVILQIVGALLVMLFVLFFIKNMLFLFAMVLTIHIYTSLISSMFQDRLVTDIVEVLPWDLIVFKETLIKWASYLSLIFLIPYGVYAYFHFSLWIFPQFIIIIFAFKLILRVKIEKMIQKLNKKHKKTEWIDGLCFGLLLLLIFSDTFPLILILGCLLIGIIPLLQRNYDVH